MTAPGDHGFAIDETEVIHWGLCPECSAARADPSTTPGGTAP